MPTYKITITATVSKVLTVEAANEDTACALAEEQFCPNPDGTEEGYTQGVSDCAEVN